jgi:predicted Zn-dependent protease
MAVGCLKVLESAERRPSDSPFEQSSAKIDAAGGEVLGGPLLAADRDEKDMKQIFKILEGVGAVATGIGGIDYESERAIGESLALEGLQRYGMPVNHPELQRYVNLVGGAVARNSGRPGIPYRFITVDSPLYNAFACPGGIIFVSSALMKLMEDESELACVLAHEVAHVSHKHALESIRRAKFFEGVGKITAATMKGSKGKEFKHMIGDLQTVLFDKGLDQNMEFEADTSGMETAFRTGYDPAGMIRVLQALQAKEAGSQKAGSWFSTHPPLSMRLRVCNDRLQSYPDAQTLATVGDRFVHYRALIP